MTVGERIEQERKRNNLTMEALAQKLGVGRSAINKWEKGYVENISRPNIQKMAEIFGCNAAWLGGYMEENIKSYNTPEEFELAWHRGGGGRHPITLSDLEHEIILSFRCKDEKTQENVCKLLDIEVKKENADIC